MTEIVKHGTDILTVVNNLQKVETKLYRLLRKSTDKEYKTEMVRSNASEIIDKLDYLLSSENGPISYFQELQRKQFYSSKIAQLYNMPQNFIESFKMHGYVANVPIFVKRYSYYIESIENTNDNNAMAENLMRIMRKNLAETMHLSSKL